MVMTGWCASVSPAPPPLPRTPRAPLCASAVPHERQRLREDAGGGRHGRWAHAVERRHRAHPAAHATPCPQPPRRPRLCHASPLARLHPRHGLHRRPHPAVAHLLRRQWGPRLGGGGAQQPWAVGGHLVVVRVARLVSLDPRHSSHSSMPGYRRLSTTQSMPALHAPHRVPKSRGTGFAVAPSRESHVAFTSDLARPFPIEGANNNPAAGSLQRRVAPHQPHCASLLVHGCFI